MYYLIIDTLFLLISFTDKFCQRVGGLGVAVVVEMFTSSFVYQTAKLHILGIVSFKIKITNKVSKKAMSSFKN